MYTFLMLEILKVETTPSTLCYVMCTIWKNVIFIKKYFSDILFAELLVEIQSFLIHFAFIFRIIPTHPYHQFKSVALVAF